MNILKKILLLIFRIIKWFFISTVLVVILYRFIPPPATPLMFIRIYDQWADEKREVRLYKDWVALEEISRYMPMALITSEDQNFDMHFGFDLKAIEKARKYNARHEGRKTRGASTISQQTAKNVFLWPNRSYLRKGLEVYFTFLIEVFWSKERIMEVYLNVIELGDGVYGVEAASKEYFNRASSKLTKSQAALIAACVPNPLRWSPRKPTPYILKKQRWIMRHMSYIKRPDYIQ